MVSVHEAIARRRMIRSYTSDPIETTVLDEIVASAYSGPSAGNTRSLHVLVLTRDAVEDYWNITLSADKRSTFPWPGLLIAPVLLIPYVNPSMYIERYSARDKARTGLGDGIAAWPVPYWWVDGGAAVENVLLTIAANDLGACFFGQFEHEEAVRASFGVPNDYRAVGTISVGHPDVANDRPSASSRRPRRRVAETTHRDRW